MKLASDTIRLIDKSFEEKQQEEEPRGYLGASSLGGPCSRQLWYRFRWVRRPVFPGRVLRLFQRGHREEDVFAAMLRKIGVTVYERDPVNNKQIAVPFDNPHVKGHADGVGVNLPELGPDVFFVCEWKTHGDKSFKQLSKNGVEISHPVHFTQCQLYMKGLDLPYALYGAVNKNTDDLHLEVLPYDSAHAEDKVLRADLLVEAEHPPYRISDNPGWYQCRFCDFHEVCHKGAPSQVTCRSCQHVRPLSTGSWLCLHHNVVLTTDDQREACTEYTPINMSAL